MAVSIPISASAAGVTQALRDIEAAIAKAGQTGREFAKLDLSHPELAGLATEIRRVQQRVEDLARVSRGATATAFRSVIAAGGGAVDPLSWQTNLPRVFTNPAQMAAHQSAVGNYVFQGTRWQAQTSPQSYQGGGGNWLGGVPGFAGGPWGGSPTGGGGVAPPAPPAGGGSGGGGTGGGGGGLFSSLIGGVKGGIGFGLAQAGISGIKQIVGESIDKAQQEAMGVEDLYRHTEQTKSYIDLRDAVMASTKAFGINAQEAARMSLTWAKMTGDSSPGAILAGTRISAGIARAYGMDPGATTQTIAQASNAGIDPRTFATLVGEAAAKGGRSTDETMGSLLRVAETSANMFIDKLGTNLVQSAGMMAGLNATGLAGMRNGGSERVMEQLGGAISRGGNAGVASAALSYKVGMRQGVTDPYDLQFLQEGGLFASAKSALGYGSSETNFQARLAVLKGMYAGMPQNQLLSAMETDLGPNMRLGKALLNYKDADVSTTFGALSNAGINPETMSPTSIADAVRIANAKPGDLGGERTNMLMRHGPGALSAEDQKTLTGADPGSLRNVLLQMAGKYGQESTEGTETRVAMTNLSNAMTKIGEGMLKPLNDVKDGLSMVGEQLGDLGAVLSDVYKASTGDPAAKQRLLSDFNVHRRGIEGEEGSEAPLADAAKKDTAAQLLAHFMSPEGGGYSRQAALGLVASAGAESGYRAHPPHGDGGIAAGLYQWHPDRQAAIEAHFGKRVDEMTLMEQAAAKTWEQSEGGPEAAAGAVLRRSGSAYTGGYNESLYDQRPGAGEVEAWKRGMRAERLDKMLPETPELKASVDVVHRDSSGQILHIDNAPLVTVTPPQPWGPAAKGADEPKPPPPPPSKMPMGLGAVGTAGDGKAWWR